ncbi:type II toxin-antitoxin system VapC family toxin [Dactylococcopsis salina]|uniref:Ribonuclease VapC n=1 Tax=Dactylococcopsis salina (strain PCC 8305) TaxID=13035 RepID=K9YXE7_DACS8|nr:type II toxin-antitoxin system VapC family toxin [Dactylococcopsis salina]AFZ51010.1 putative nucleic acid-binding protein, contains PIN domain [Dactylococcopsis salina PCC 8305]
MIILDTNVISEVMRPQPNTQVMSWLKKYPVEELAITSISIAEISYGLKRLPVGRRRDSLQWRFQMFIDQGFSDRIFPFEERAAEIYAEIIVDRKQQGKPIEVMDAMIASIALLKTAILATRNVSDFENCGLELVNPWEIASEI